MLFYLPAVAIAMTMMMVVTAIAAPVVALTQTDGIKIAESIEMGSDIAVGKNYSKYT